MKDKKVLIIIVLILVVLGLVGYIGYSEGWFVKDKPAEPSNPEVKEEKEEILGLYDEVVLEALKNMPSIPIDYGKNVKDMSKYELISTALDNMDNKYFNVCTDNLTKTVTIDDLNEALNKSVRDAKITIEDIKTESTETSGFFGSWRSITVKNNKLYLLGSCDGPGPGPRAHNAIIGVKAEKIGNNVYIYQKIAYGEIDDKHVVGESHYYPSAYYKDKAHKELIVDEVSDDYQLEKYWPKFDTYKLTFEKVDNTYYFVSSEKE